MKNSFIVVTLKLVLLGIRQLDYFTRSEHYAFGILWQRWFWDFNFSSAGMGSGKTRQKSCKF